MNLLPIPGSVGLIAEMIDRIVKAARRFFRPRRKRSKPAPMIRNVRAWPGAGRRFF